MTNLFPYGLDAPPVVRNLALGALACWLLFAFSNARLLPIDINGAIWPAATLSFGALAMIWSSRWGKVRRRERLLGLLDWRGDESVLDVGCGRGLLAVAAARRTPSGHVVGIDIWQAEDLSGNGPDAPLFNAQREGVGNRVSTRTADMRDLPFADGCMDIVVSSTAIHNIAEEAGRDRAIGEIARVLRPGGQILIDDIRHLNRYADQLRAAGLHARVQRSAGSWFWWLLSIGSLYPGTIAIGNQSGTGVLPPTAV